MKKVAIVQTKSVKTIAKPKKICFNNHRKEVVMMKCFSIDFGQMLKVTRLDSSKFSPPQEHVTRQTNEYILYIVTEGRLHLWVDGEELILEAGDLYLFDKGVFQKPAESTQCTFYYLHFQTDGFSALSLSEEEYYNSILQRKADFLTADIYRAETYDYIKVLIKQKMHVEDKLWLNQIVGICKANVVSYGNNTPEWRINVSNAAAGILMRMEEYAFEASGKSYVTKHGCVYNNVARIVDYVEKHYRENFGSADIERELLINFDYANRIFKKHVGYSIIRYRNHLRLHTAKTMLDGKLGEVTMDTVAEAVGFGNRYYFSRCFKK